MPYRPRRQLVIPHSLPWKGRKQAARGFLPLATTSNLAVFLVGARRVIFCFRSYRKAPHLDPCPSGLAIAWNHLDGLQLESTPLAIPSDIPGMSLEELDLLGQGRTEAGMSPGLGRCGAPPGPSPFDPVNVTSPLTSSSRAE